MPGSPGHRNGGGRGKDHGHGSELDPRSVAYRKAKAEARKHREQQDAFLTEEVRRARYASPSYIVTADNSDALDRLADEYVAEHPGADRDAVRADWKQWLEEVYEGEEEAEEEEERDETFAELYEDPEHNVESGPQEENVDAEDGLTDKRDILFETLERVKVERKAQSKTRAHKSAFTLMEDLLVTLAREQNQRTRCGYKKALVEWEDFVERENLGDHIRDESEGEEQSDGANSPPRSAESETQNGGETSAAKTGRNRGRARGSKSPPQRNEASSASAQPVGQDGNGEELEDKLLAMFVNIREQMQLDGEREQGYKRSLRPPESRATSPTFQVSNKAVVNEMAYIISEGGSGRSPQAEFDDLLDHFQDKFEFSDSDDDNAEDVAGSDEQDSQASGSDTDDFWAQQERAAKEDEQKAMLKLHKENLLDERAQQIQATKGGDFQDIRARLAAADNPSAWSQQLAFVADRKEGLTKKRAQRMTSGDTEDVHGRFETFYKDPFASSQPAQSSATTSKPSSSAFGPRNKPPPGRAQQQIMEQLLPHRAAAINVGSTAGHEEESFYGSRSADSPAVSQIVAGQGLRRQASGHHSRRRTKTGYSETSPPYESASVSLFSDEGDQSASGPNGGQLARRIEQQQASAKAAARVSASHDETASRHKGLARHRAELKESAGDKWESRVTAGPPIAAELDVARPRRRGIPVPSECEIMPPPDAPVLDRLRRESAASGHVAATPKVSEVGKSSGRGLFADKARQYIERYSLPPPAVAKHPRKSVVHPSNPHETQPRMLAPAPLSGSVAASSGPRLPRGPITPPEVETAASTPIISQVVPLSAAVDATKSPESASTTQFAVKACPITPGSSATETATSSSSPGFVVPTYQFASAVESMTVSGEDEFVNVKVLEDTPVTTTFTTPTDAASTSTMPNVDLGSRLPGYTPALSFDTPGGTMGGVFFTEEQWKEWQIRTLTEYEKRQAEREKQREEAQAQRDKQRDEELERKFAAIANSFRQQPDPKVPTGASNVKEAGGSPSTSCATPPRASRRLNTSAVPALSSSSRSAKRSSFSAPPPTKAKAPKVVEAAKEKGPKAEFKEFVFELRDRDETFAALLRQYFDDPLIMKFLPGLEMQTRHQKMVSPDYLVGRLTQMIGPEELPETFEQLRERYQSTAVALDYADRFEQKRKDNRKGPKRGQDLINALNKFVAQLLSIQEQERAAVEANLGDVLPTTPIKPKRAAPVKVEAQSAKVSGRVLRHRSLSMSHSSAASDADKQPQPQPQPQPRFYNYDIESDKTKYYDDRKDLLPPQPGDKNELPAGTNAVPEIRLGAKTTDYGTEHLYYAMGVDAADWRLIKEWLDHHLQQQLRLCARLDTPFTDPHYLSPEQREQYRYYLENIKAATLEVIDELPPACTVPAMFSNWRELRDSVKKERCQELRKAGVGVFHFDATELRNIQGFTNAAEIDIKKHVPATPATDDGPATVAGAPRIYELKVASSKQPDAYFMTDVTDEFHALKAAPETLEDIRKAFYYKAYDADTEEIEKQCQKADLDSVSNLLGENPPKRLELSNTFVEETWKQQPNIDTLDDSWWAWLHDQIVIKKQRVIFAQYLMIDHSFINPHQTSCLFDTTNRHCLMSKMFGQFAPVTHATSQIRPGPGPCYQVHHESGRLASFNLCLAGGMLHYFAPARDITRIREYERKTLYPEEYKKKKDGGKFCDKYYQHNTMVYRATHWLKAGAEVSVVHQKPGDALMIYDGTVHFGLAVGAEITTNVSWNILEPLWFLCQMNKAFKDSYCNCPVNSRNVEVNKAIDENAFGLLTSLSTDKSAFFTADYHHACPPCGINPDWSSAKDLAQRMSNHHKAWRVNFKEPRVDACEFVVGRFPAEQRSQLNWAKNMMKKNQREVSERCGPESDADEKPTTSKSSRVRIQLGRRKKTKRSCIPTTLKQADRREQQAKQKRDEKARLKAEASQEQQKRGHKRKASAVGTSQEMKEEAQDDFYLPSSDDESSLPLAQVQKAANKRQRMQQTSSDEEQVREKVRDPIAENFGRSPDAAMKALSHLVDPRGPKPTIEIVRSVEASARVASASTGSGGSSQADEGEVSEAAAGGSSDAAQSAIVVEKVEETDEEDESEAMADATAMPKNIMADQ